MAGSSAAAVAAHRLGLGESDLSVVGQDPAAWVKAQIDPADPQPGEGLATVVDGLKAQARFFQAQRMQMTATDARPEQRPTENLRDINRDDQRAHLSAAIGSTRPFAERLALFWANHFTISTAKPQIRALAGAFEREAIRPNIAGPFERLLKAAITHGAMIRYLDNDRSAGPQSRQVQQRSRRLQGTDELRERPMGLNENLAREVLELHTLGAASKAYTQQDVTAFAAVLTGWRFLPRPQDLLNLPSDAAVVGFDTVWHEPGSKTVMGQRIPEGAGGLDAVVAMLVRHPATAQFVALKLARHFVADEPPPDLVQTLAARFQSTQGDLSQAYSALIESPHVWHPTPSKLKSPAEFVISSYRLLSLGAEPLKRQPDAGIGTLGQRIQAAPSPAGWPDRQEDWLGPEAVWKRVEWAARLGERHGKQVDARRLAEQSLGTRLTAATARQIERAADGPQALALLLMSPEFQRR